MFRNACADVMFNGWYLQLIRKPSDNATAHKMGYLPTLVSEILDADYIAGQIIWQKN